MELFVFVILLTVTGAQESKLEGPQNTLSVVGSNVTLNCLSLSGNCSGIEWLKYIAGNTMTVFNHYGIISLAYRERYSVDNNSSGGCDLVIKNVQLTDAGRFLCRAIISSNTVEKTAHLIILEIQPKCTVTTFWHELAAGDEVQFNCVVTYNGTNTASMVLKEATDAPAAVENGKTISLHHSVVAFAPKVPSFICITSFPADDDKGKPIIGMATNIPNTTCKTPVIKVISVQQFRVEKPQNTLSIAGLNVTLTCLSPSTNCSGIVWLKYSSGTNPRNVFNDSAGIFSPYADRYRVDKSSGCDLVIKNVELTDAGRFICSTLISTRIIERTAYLIIMEKQPNCSVNASLDNTVEGDGVWLTCRVTHNGALNVSMRWIGVEDAPTAVEYGKTVNRSYYVVASAPEVPSFTCATLFAVETNDKGGLASNILNTTCETPAVRVLYSVRSVNLSPSLAVYAPGRVINCTAKGNPSPTLKWQGSENDGIWMDILNQNGSEFTVNEVTSKRYRCFAMNAVRDQVYNATSHEFLVNNTNSVADDNGSFTATTIISVAVGVLLLIILLIICFCERVCPGHKCCHSGNKSKDKIRVDQPLTENPDPCIYSVVNKRQDAHPKAKRSEPPKQGASPQAMPRTDNPKAGHTNAYQYEEVTYADLAMEVGPRKVVPKYNPEAQETLYAAVGTA